jgi:DNA polymerase III subunit epsilon
MHRRGDFVAIDFETADYYPDSACAVGLVRVAGNRIVERSYSLIRPPRRLFVFTYLHGIDWEMVAEAPSFGELWPQLAPLLNDAAFLSAHNASFDRNVLHTCCQASGVQPPTLPFVCTVTLARRTWKLFPTKLPNVCDYLNIGLTHHHALADAEACARIVLAARGK